MWKKEQLCPLMPHYLIQLSQNHCLSINLASQALSSRIWTRWPDTLLSHLFQNQKVLIISCMILNANEGILLYFMENTFLLSHFGSPHIYMTVNMLRA